MVSVMAMVAVTVLAMGTVAVLVVMVATMGLVAMFSGCWSLVAIVCAVPVVATVVMVIAMGTVMVVTMMMVLMTAVVAMSVPLVIGIGLTFKTNSSLNLGLGLLMSAVEKYLFDSSRKLCRLRCCCIRTYRVWTHCVLHHSSNKLIHSNFAIMIHIQSLK